ncbi:anti-sigma factor antagonist [Streptomyces sp. NPDC057616]|uniref:anti-sigma factor antagonist n=1 Tax=Streptomyces sp. NPDC057616 TaxID=3346183 RepID=UPI003684B26B
MTVRVDAAGDRLAVTVSGELDLDSDPFLQQTLNKALDRTTGGLELDLAGVDFCDCSALNVLLDVRDRARLSGKQITLSATSRAVQRLLTLTNTLPLFTEDPADPNRSAGPAPNATTTPPAHPADERATPDAITTHGARHHPSTAHAGPSRDRLVTENAQLHRAMETRTSIDLARGMLMASFHLTPEQAWQVLVTASQHTNTKLHQVADALLHTADGHTPLPEPLADHLATAVQIHRK